MHRKANRNNADLFFECAQWNGEIVNNEPEKCGELRFFNLNALPINIVPYIKKILTKTSQESLYLEEGW